MASASSPCENRVVDSHQTRCVTLTIIQIGDTYVPRAPLTDKGTAMGVWIFYTLFVLIAFVVEKGGRRRQINAP